MAGFLENIEATEGGKDALADLALAAKALGDLKILVRTRGFDAEEHGNVCIYTIDNKPLVLIHHNTTVIGIIWHYKSKSE